MILLPKPSLRKLEDEQLWREANYITTHIYEKAHDFPDSETYYTASKLRAAAVDLLFYVSEALGSTLGSTAAGDWSHARKAASAIKTVYPFTARQNFMELEPDFMVRLNKVMTLIDKEVEAADTWVRQAVDADLDQWREKYKIWKKINDK